MAIIDFPTVNKWFIAYNDKNQIMSYGLVTPNANDDNSVGTVNNIQYRRRMAAGFSRCRY